MFNISNKAQIFSLATLFYIHTNKGELETVIGYYDEAEKDLQIARNIAEKLNSNKLKFQTFTELAGLYLRQSKLNEVEYYIKKIQEIAFIMKDNLMIAKGKNMLARCIYRENGEYKLALKSFFEALSIYEREKYNYGIAYSLREIGNVYLMLKEWDKAEEYGKKSLDIQREIGNISNIAYGLNDLSCVYNHTGEYSKAKELLLEAASLTEKTGDVWLLEAIYSSLGDSFRELGDDAISDYYYQKSLEIAKKINDKNFLDESE